MAVTRNQKARNNTQHQRRIKAPNNKTSTVVLAGCRHVDVRRKVREVNHHRERYQGISLRHPCQNLSWDDLDGERTDEQLFEDFEDFLQEKYRICTALLGMMQS